MKKRNSTKIILTDAEKEKDIILNSLSELVVYLDTDMRVLWANRVAGETANTKPEKLIGRHCYEIWHQRTKSCEGCPVEEALKTGQQCESEINSPDGRVWFIRGYPVRDVRGKVKGVIEFATDITARKNAENQILIANKRLQYLLSSTAAVIYTSKVSGSYGATFVSDNITQVTGYKPQDFVNNENFWIKHVHPKDHKRVLKEAQIIFERKTHTHEYRFRHKNGDYIWVRDEMRLVEDAKGKPLEIIGYWIDVTKNKQSELELERLTKELLKSNEKLKTLSLIDSHTGLYNHRYLEEIISSEFYRARRSAQPLSVIMLDIDYFKSINDTYGHQFGDEILKQFGKLLKRKVRRYDIVVRFGGEEFIIISPGTDRTTAYMLIQRLLETIRLFNFGNSKHSIRLKLSAGVASYPEDKAAKGMQLVDSADSILNKAKEDGGDRAYCSMDVARGKGVILREEKPDVKALKGRIEKLTKRSNQSLIESIFALAKTIELKDHYTGEHVERTVDYATEIAKSLYLSPEEIEHIRQASVLHDLGKIGISDKLLLKQKKLTKKEFEEIKKHPQIAADILRPIHFMHDIIPLIFYHHERWDGKGYPNGLKRDEIPIGARVIALADVYQALVSDRAYRKAFPKDKVLNIIKKGSGTQFDPKIVNIFLKILKRKKEAKKKK